MWNTLVNPLWQKIKMKSLEPSCVRLGKSSCGGRPAVDPLPLESTETQKWQLTMFGRLRGVFLTSPPTWSSVSLTFPLRSLITPSSCVFGRVFHQKRKPPRFFLLILTSPICSFPSPSLPILFIHPRILSLSPFLHLVSPARSSPSWPPLLYGDCFDGMVWNRWWASRGERLLLRTSALLNTNRWRDSRKSNKRRQDSRSCTNQCFRMKFRSFHVFQTIF